MLIGLLGFQPHPWTSVERTRRFYLRALSEEFGLLDPESTGRASFSAPPDIILNFSGRTGWFLGERPDCPLAFALHGGPVLEHRFLQEHLPRYRGSDLFIVNCQSDEVIIRNLVSGRPANTLRLPLPVDQRVFFPRNRTECRSLLPFSADVVLGYVARLLPQKNLHQFLLMLAEVRQRLHPRTVHGIIIGNYWLDYPVLPYRTSRYPQLIHRCLTALGLEGAVTFLPATLADEHLAVCYGAMDVLVHPTHSIDENFGYAPVEAMACGVPVVGTAYGGLKDTVLDGKTGFLMPTWMTPNGIRMELENGIRAVIRLLQDADLYREMSSTAARHVTVEYAENVCGEVLRRGLRAAVEAHRSGGAQPLHMSAAPVCPWPPSASALPDASPSWTDYMIPIARYVSGPCPQVRMDSHLRLSWPERKVYTDVVEIDDPAWPARYAIDETDRQIVERCERPAFVHDLSEEFAVPPPQLLARLQRLVECGLLTTG